MDIQVILATLKNLKVARFEENAKYNLLENLFNQDYVLGV